MSIGNQYGIPLRRRSTLNDPKEVITIQSLPYDIETGDKLEPEEMQIERTIVDSANLEGRSTGEIFGQLPIKMGRVDTAIDFANQQRGQCLRCKHFDQAGFQKWKRENEGTAFGQTFLNQIKKSITFGDYDSLDLEEQRDIEYNINFMGWCRIYTEILNDPVLVTPIGTCDPADCPPTNPLGFFDAVSSGDEKISTTLYDGIMKAAQFSK